MSRPWRDARYGKMRIDIAVLPTGSLTSFSASFVLWWPTSSFRMGHFDS